MYIRYGLLGLNITFAVTVGRDKQPEEATILGGSTHNFERFVDETWQYEEEPDARLGFH